MLDLQLTTTVHSRKSGAPPPSHLGQQHPAALRKMLTRSSSETEPATGLDNGCERGRGARLWWWQPCFPTSSPSSIPGTSGETRPLFICPAMFINLDRQGHSQCCKSLGGLMEGGGWRVQHSPVDLVGMTRIWIMTGWVRCKNILAYCIYVALYSDCIVH